MQQVLNWVLDAASPDAYNSEPMQGKEMMLQGQISDLVDHQSALTLPDVNPGESHCPRDVRSNGIIASNGDRELLSG